MRQCAIILFAMPNPKTTRKSPKQPVLGRRMLGRAGFPVSELGFGAWGIGRSWWGATDDKASRASIRSAWDAGVNFFDTAYVYGDGHSEKLLGQVLKGRSARIASKIPPKNRAWPPRPDTPLHDAFPADWIVSCTERSLKNLRRDTLDLQQFHVWTDGWLANDEWKEAVQTLRRQGKIAAFGVSINDHDPDSALKLVASGLVDSVQVIFNIFEQEPLKRLFPLCRAHQVGVIARVPFDEGGLTGTLTRETTFENGDFRRQYFGGDRLAETVKRVEKLTSLLGRNVATVPELALRFILSHADVSTVIPGMRQERHVRANVAAAAAGPLDPRLLAGLRQHAWRKNFYGWWGDD